MWSPTLQLVLTSLYLQVTTSSSSPCPLFNLIAACASKGLRWVPALPANITHLYLEVNYIGEINSTSLRRYPELQEVDLGAQNVPLVIRNNAFLRQRSLKKLVLGANAGLRLEPRAFAGLFRLQALYLENCDLSESILAESFLQPLLSLELLNLFGNKVSRLRPGRFFSSLTKFTHLNLKLNQIGGLCEDDLVGFRGKYFSLLNLESNDIARMYEGDSESCGNPFRDMTIDVLDLSTNGFGVDETRRFFTAISGTPVFHLKFSNHMGKGFSHSNLPDPDRHTFESLGNSSVDQLDLSKNFIFTLQKAVFSPLQVARIIDVSQNKVNQIDRNAFEGLQGHLRMLNLSHNLLGEIYSHTFSSLRDLRVLDLSYNHIGALGYQAFRDLPMLRGLYLTGNSLRYLGSTASLPNLEILLLDDNRLSFLSGLAELGANSKHVDLRNNRLTNMEDVYFLVTHFKNLQNVFFSGNFIKWCTLDVNSTVPSNNSLKVLELQDSSLQVIWGQGLCLDLFDNLNNLLGLGLSLNQLKFLPTGIFRGLSSIIEIDLSSNSLTFLEPDVFPLTLKRLDLSNNFLASPDPTTFRSLLILSLAGNRFLCDCSLENFLLWLNVTNVTLSPAGSHRCEFPAALHGLPLLDYATVVEPCEEDDEQSVQELKLALFVLSALLTVTVVLGALVYARLRGHIFVIYKRMVGRVLEGPKPEAAVDEAQYDAFLCFSNADYPWVEAALLQKLDSQFSEENVFSCCLEARDFLPGEDHLSNIRHAIWGSRKTVCVISKEFLKDGWCLETFTVAQGRMLEQLEDILILLVVGKVNPYQLMRYNAIRSLIRNKEYLIWPEDPQDLDWFYERLITRMLKNNKVQKPPEDRGQEAAQNPQPQEDIQLQEVIEAVRL